VEIDCAYRLDEIVETVDIILSSSLPARQKVTGAMVSWLVCGADDESGLGMLEELELGTFVLEACTNWTLAHLS
jgi:hypothetical protein